MTWHNVLSRLTDDMDGFRRIYLTPPLVSLLLLLLQMMTWRHDDADFAFLVNRNCSHVFWSYGTSRQQAVQPIMHSGCSTLDVFQALRRAVQTSRHQQVRRSCWTKSLNEPLRSVHVLRAYNVDLPLLGRPYDSNGRAYVLLLVFVC